MTKFVKFNYKNKELLWLKVDKFENGYYHAWVDNKNHYNKKH